MGVKTREHLTGGAVRPPVASAETAKCVAVITSHRWRSTPHATPRVTWLGLGLGLTLTLPLTPTLTLTLTLALALTLTHHGGVGKAARAVRRVIHAHAQPTDIATGPVSG